MLNYCLCNDKLTEQIHNTMWDVVICGLVQSLTHKSCDMLTEKQVVVQRRPCGGHNNTETLSHCYK